MIQLRHKKIELYIIEKLIEAKITHIVSNAEKFEFEDCQSMEEIENIKKRMSSELF
jgi:hypothetical protein